MSNLSLHSHAKTALVQVHIINDKIIDENETESNSKSESNNSNSDNSDNTRQTELTELTELTKDGINNDNILDTLSRKKSKFALPAAYHNMSPHTVKKILKTNEDAIIEYTKQISLDPNHPHHNIHKQIEIQQKHIKKISRPNMSIMPISSSIPSTHQLYHIQHAVPYNINNLHIPPKDHKYNHKHKINKSNKSNKKHRKKKNKSVATSVVSELVLHQLRTILHVPLHYFHSTPLYAPFLSDLTTSDKNMNLSLRSNAEQYSHIAPKPSHTQITHQSRTQITPSSPPIHITSHSHIAPKPSHTQITHQSHTQITPSSHIAPKSPHTQITSHSHIAPKSPHIHDTPIIPHSYHTPQTPPKPSQSPHIHDTSIIPHSHHTPQSPKYSKYIYDDCKCC